MNKYSNSTHARHGISFRGRSNNVVVGLEKSSSMTDQVNWLVENAGLDPRILRWFKQPGNVDLDRFAYSIVAPVGACESWGQTLNGDAFEREWLAPRTEKYGHKTFEIYARAYVHHVNKDPSKSYGDNPCMFWSDKMDRCEGVWRLSRDAAKRQGTEYVLNNIEAGKDVEISMGTHVPYDVCSVCGHKSKTPAEWCSCIRKRGFGHVCPHTGLPTRVFNPTPRFFDLSAVSMKAAPEAFVLGALLPFMLTALSGGEKVSSAVQSVSGVLPVTSVWEHGMANGARLTKLSSVGGVVPLKVSDILKEVPALQSFRLVNKRRGINKLKSIPPSAPCSWKSAGLTADSILSSLGSMGVVLDPDSFAYMDREFPMSEVNMSPEAIRRECDVIGESLADTHSVNPMYSLPRMLRGDMDVSNSADDVMSDQLKAAYQNYLSQFLQKLPSLVVARLQAEGFTPPEHSVSFRVAADIRCFEKSSSLSDRESVLLQAAAPAVSFSAITGQSLTPQVMLPVLKATSDPSIAPLYAGVAEWI